MIADGERAIALAGIMGGEETEVSAATTNVLLEAANFEPVGILRSSERLALRTEGSNRWEKGVDPHVAGPAATLATQLHRRAGRRALDRGRRTCRRAAGAGGDPAAAGAGDASARARRARRRAGGDPRPARLRAAKASGFRVPTWRARDVTREIDLIEEVARFKLDRDPVHAAAP